jgi:hypothetical protein
MDGTGWAKKAGNQGRAEGENAKKAIIPPS